MSNLNLGDIREANAILRREGNPDEVREALVKEVERLRGEDQQIFDFAEKVGVALNATLDILERVQALKQEWNNPIRFKSLTTKQAAAKLDDAIRGEPH